MARRTRQPGPISAPVGKRIQPPKWRRLLLGGADGSIDPSSKIVSSSDSASESSVTIGGGTATNKAGEGGLWWWTMGANRYDYGRPHCLYVALEITTAPGNTSNTAVCIGLCDAGSGMPNKNQLGVGLHYDAGTGPDVRTFAGGWAPTPSDSGAASDRVGVIGQILLGPGRRAWEYVNAWAYNSSGTWKLTRQSSHGATTGVPQPGTDLFVSVGRSNTVAGNATVGFRAHYLLFSTPPSVGWQP